MPPVDRNPWYKPLMRELRAGRMTISDAARLAGVSRERVSQWCEAAGFDAAKAWRHRLTVFYARELLKMAKRDRLRVAAPIKALGRRRARPKAKKPEQRAVLDQQVIDFVKAGGKIKRLPPRKL